MADLRQPLEEAILDDPADRAARCAFADWLTDQPDSGSRARGEFMQVQLALEDPDRPAEERQRLQQREAELLAAHEAEWLGGLAPYLLGSAEPRHQRWLDDLAPARRQTYGQLAERPGCMACRWAEGMLDRLEFDYLTINQARVARDLGAARFLRELGVNSNWGAWACQYDPGADVPENTTSGLEVLLGSAPWVDSLRAFQFGEPPFEPDSPDQRHGNTWIHLRPLLEGMPRLEELRIFGNPEDGPEILSIPTLTRLRVLQLYHFYAYPLRRLAENPAFNRLTHLLCFPHGFFDFGDAEDYQHDDEERTARDAALTLTEVRAVCRSSHLRALTHLQLRCCDAGDAGIQEIVESGLLDRLKVLDLRFGAVTDAGARLLAEQPATARLELLDLAENRLTADGIARLQRILPGVRVEEQQEEPYTADYFYSVGDNE
jgi:uncharacterized protein (TIGR02996 family)